MQPKILSAAQIAKLKDSGVDVKEHAKLVKGELDVPALVAALEKMAAAQQELANKQHQQMIKAIEALTRSISYKEVGKGTDLSELIAAVSALKQEAVVMHEPVDYLMTAERDQRHLINVEKGIRFTAVPKRLDS